MPAKPLPTLMMRAPAGGGGADGRGDHQRHRQLQLRQGGQPHQRQRRLAQSAAPMSVLARRRLSALAAVAFWAGGAHGQSQDVPQVISPLRVETDHNNVNIVSGKTTIEPPSLSVPGAPNLRYDRVQNAAPYARGTVTGQGETTTTVNWSVHTGSGSSESFVFNDLQDCNGVTGTRSPAR